MAPRIKPEQSQTSDDVPCDEFPERIIIDDASFDALTAAIASPRPPNAKLRALFQNKK
jgi:uncharacterized protein (DUF1778 family)